MNLVALCLLLLSAAPVFALGSWRSLGPYGGAADIVRVIPDKKDQVLAATGNGLVFLSRNGAASWEPVAFPSRPGAVLHAIEVDPHSGDTWYVGIEAANLHISGIYRTTDAGRSWMLLPQTSGLAVWSIAFAPSAPDIMAAGTGAGVYLSRDHGATWKLISPPGDPELRPVVSLAFDPANPDTIYAGTTHLPWKTSDAGANWQSIHAGMIDDSDVFSIVPDAKRPGRVLASACSGAYASADRAARWTRLNTPKGAFRTYFIAIDPAHPDTVFAGTSDGLAKSTTGGSAWRMVSRVPVKSIAFDPFVPSRMFFASAADGLLVSSDGGETLRQSNVGFTNRAFTSFTAAGGFLYVGGSSDLYGSASMALRWDNLGPLPGNDHLLVVAASPDSPRTVFGAGYHGLFESVDGGKTWRTRSGLPEGSRSRSLVAARGGVLFAGTDHGLFRSNAGSSFTRVSPSPVEWMQASGRNLAALNSSTAIVSRNGGATWSTCSAPAPGVAWYALAIDPSSPDVALAATSRGLYRSEDACRAWTPAMNGLDQATAEAVLFHPTRTGEAFVAQAGKVFLSIDRGRNWRPLDSTGGFWPSSFLIPASAPDRLFALVPGRGVFSTTAPPSTAVTNAALAK